MQENDLAYWMKKAINLANKAKEIDEVPIGAVLVHEGKILGEGYNTREKKGLTTAHAEIEALSQYNERAHQWRVPQGTQLFVTAEPCLMCTGALLWARVDAIYFGCADSKNAGLSRIEKWISEGVYDHQFKEIKGGIVAEDCSQILSQYFKEKRKSKN